MPDTGPKSTLSEVNRKMAEVCFNIMAALDATKWTSQSQVRYSLTTDIRSQFDTYMRQNKARDIDFPFGMLTRMSNIKFQLNPRTPDCHVVAYTKNNSSEVDSARIKPAQVDYEFYVYEEDMEDIEFWVNHLSVDSLKSPQRVEWTSVILNMPTRATFVLDEPEHAVIPAFDERSKGTGDIYALRLPMTVDCVLGIPQTSKPILEIINDIYTLPEELVDSATVPDETINITP